MRGLCFVLLVVAAVSLATQTCSPDTLDRAVAFLKACPAEGKFHVQGWRWHTLSMVREMSRLNNLATSISSRKADDELDSLMKAADYVVDFNMKGLHRVERDIFFPWVRTKIGTVDDTEAVSALSSVLGSLEADQVQLAIWGGSLVC